MQCPPEDSSDEEWGLAEQRFRDGLQEFIGDAPITEDRPLDAELRFENVIGDMFGQVDARMQDNEDAPTEEDEECAEARDADNWDYAAFEGADDPRDRLQEDLEEQLRVPLFREGRASRLGATVALLNAFKTHKAPAVLIDEVFKLLSQWILPSPNSLPENEKAATRFLRKMGLTYDLIHACPRSCCLFRGDLVHKEHCPHCGSPRFTRGNIPAKVLRHFHLIPRLRRMFGIQKISELLVWHHHNKSTDGLMRGPADSPQWAFIDSKYPEFAADPRRLRFILSADGVNPFGNKNCSWSTWPVIATIANLPPWLMTKNFFLLLCLLIPGREQPTGEQFDIFLQPLLEELNTLWVVGVGMRDAAAFMGQPVFKCFGVLLFTTHDLPGYGIVAGLATKGYKGCVHCGPQTVARYSRSLRKVVYNSEYRRWLNAEHRFRSDDELFGGNPELRPPPVPSTAMQLIEWGAMRKSFLLAGGRPKRSDPCRHNGVKRIPSLYQLPYFKVSLQNSYADFSQLCRFYTVDHVLLYCKIVNLKAV